MSKTATLKYLTYADVVDLKVPDEVVVDCTEQVMISFGRGLAQCPPKPAIHPRDGTFCHAMPAYVKDTDITGMKWVAGFPGNREKNIPTTNGLIILNDSETGLPIAIMDGKWITTARTAAVAGLNVKYCKVSNSEAMTVVGAGYQSKWNMPYIKRFAPELKTCYVNDISEENAAIFIREMKEKMPDVEMISVKSDKLKEAIAKSQIVASATQALPEPIIPRDVMHPGMLGLAMEGNAWDYSIYTEVLDRFVCDDFDLAQSYQKRGAFKLGMPKEYYLLGRIADGTEVGRANDDEIVMSYCLGMAITDVALATKVLEAAKAKGVGIDLPLYLD